LPRGNSKPGGPDVKIPHPGVTETVDVRHGCFVHGKNGGQVCGRCVANPEFHEVDVTPFARAHPSFRQM
jgi:hypothetical protein